MNILIFLGPPGCGKGTQAEILSKSDDFVKVSTGDLLRDIAKKNTDFGLKIKDILDKGLLVSDDLVNDLIDGFFKGLSNTKNVILDGYPRSVIQAKSLENILKKYNTEVDKVFYFDIDEDILVKRVTGRFACSKCGSIYNSYFNNTKVENECDACHSKNFIRRGDDSEAVIRDRINVFKTSTYPLLEYYKHKLVKFDANQPKELIAELIKGNLK